MALPCLAGKLLSFCGCKINDSKIWQLESSLSQDWDKVAAETACLCSPRLESLWGGPQGWSWLNSGGPCLSKACSLIRLTLRLGRLEGEDSRTSLCGLASLEPGSLQVPRTRVTMSKAKVAFFLLHLGSHRVSLSPNHVGQSSHGAPDSLEGASIPPLRGQGTLEKTIRDGDVVESSLGSTSAPSYPAPCPAC